MRRLNLLGFGIAACVCVLAASGAGAAILKVGGTQTLKKPSDAAKIAQDGDTIRIDPGTYTDCAIWSKNNLTIEAAGSGVVLTSKSCGGKGIFVVKGRDTTISGITFSKAKVADHNGAGIRMAGTNLTVIKSTFLQNEMGILSDPNLASTVIIRDSTFSKNGSCYPNCLSGVYQHALYIGKAALLRVENSTFTEQHDGHYVKSRASRTEVVGSTIKDGTAGTGSYEIDIPNGGSVLIQGNILEKGKKSENSIAISIGEEGAKNLTPDIVITDNIYTNDSGRKSKFLRNATTTVPVLSNNTLLGSPAPTIQSAPATTLSLAQTSLSLVSLDACSLDNGFTNPYCSENETISGAGAGASPRFVAPNAVAAAAVPEPASLLVFGSALMGMLFLRRRPTVGRA